MSLIAQKRDRLTGYAYYEVYFDGKPSGEFDSFSEAWSFLQNLIISKLRRRLQEERDIDRLRAYYLELSNEHKDLLSALEHLSETIALIQSRLWAVDLPDDHGVTWHYDRNGDNFFGLINAEGDVRGPEFESPEHAVETFAIERQNTI